MNNYMRPIILFILFVLISCSSTPSIVIPPNGPALLFPLGIYYHDVQVSISGAVQNLNMNGVLFRKKNKLMIVGLSQFNSTLFKLEENLKLQKLSLVIFDDALKKYQHEFYRVYDLVVVALKARFEDLNSHYELHRNIGGQKVIITFCHFNKIFKTVRIEHPSFTVIITVNKYEI